MMNKIPVTFRDKEKIMNAWKKLIALVMSLGLTLGFAACGGNVDSLPADSNPMESSPIENNQPEELTQAALNVLIQELYTVDNLKIAVTGAYEDEDGLAYSGTGTLSYADGKFHQTMTKTYESGMKLTDEIYSGKVDGEYRLFAKVDGAWEAQAYEGLGAGEDPTSCKYYLAEILQWSTDPYFSYDGKSGMHIFTPWEKPELRVMVVGGKIVKYRIESSPENWEEGVLSYGDASVGALPTV